MKLKLGLLLLLVTMARAEFTPPARSAATPPSRPTTGPTWTSPVRTNPWDRLDSAGSTAPGLLNGTRTGGGLVAPKGLKIILTADEYNKYLKAQQKAEEDPQIKEITEQIRDLDLKIKFLQEQARALRDKALQADPEVAGILQKIDAARKKAAEEKKKS